MTGIDSSEILLLLVIGLIVLGPKRLPEIATKVGGWVGQARRMTRVMKRQLEEELSFDDTPSIKPPASLTTSATSSAPDPADPAYDADDDADDADEEAAEPEPYIPNDDDTYSPLHDEDDDADDVDNKEQSA